LRIHDAKQLFNGRLTEWGLFWCCPFHSTFAPRQRIQPTTPRRRQPERHAEYPELFSHSLVSQIGAI